MKAAILTIRFQSYWLAGTGAARGRDVDAICFRDADKLPAMPMSQVKGQLRETAERLAAMGAGGWTLDLVEQTFGYRSTDIGGADPNWRAGALAFRGEARLDDAARRTIAAVDRPKLFRRLAATKINKFGVAEDKTLRAIEAAVPVELVGRIELVGEAPPSWIDLIDVACAATLAFGKLKSDGYGRAIACVVEEKVK